jgi:hypothetical protein
VSERNDKFKGTVRRVKQKWINKMVVYRQKVEDGLDERFCSYITIFQPKLTLKYPEPCYFVELSNKNGSCYFRVRTPEKLKQVFQDCIDKIFSNKWIEVRSRLEDVSDTLIHGGSIDILSSEVMDIQEVKKDILKDDKKD